MERKVPKITLKQAQKAVEEATFIINKENSSKKRAKKANHYLQKKGFRNEELWNLDVSIACFILPRLVEFRKTTEGYPSSHDEAGNITNDMTMKKWKKILKKMIYALYIYITKMDYERTEEDVTFMEEGFDLLRKYFYYLWS